jgi:hypothetical protein
MSRGLRLVAALSLSLTAAACSTTTKQRASKSPTAKLEAGQASGSVTTAAPGDTTAAAVGGGSAQPTDRRGAAASNAPVPGAAASNTPVPVTAASKACSVEVGITYSSDLETGAAALGHPTGAPDANAAEKQKQDEIVRSIKYLNSIGGLGGCRVTPVSYSFKATNNDWVAQTQEECALFTEDHHVVAVIPGVFETWPLVDCLAAKNVPSVYISRYPLQAGDAEYKKYRGLLYETEPSIDRLGPVIDELAAQGYFTPGTKLGILGFASYDNGARAKHLINDIWKPRLAARHVTVAADYVAHGATGFADLSTTSRDCQSAVLKFRNAGVDHVLWALSGRGNRFVCDPIFDAQKYYPRQAFTSYDGSIVTGVDAANYLRGSLLVGWLPTFDIQSPTAVVKNASTDTCDKIFAGAGYPSNYFLCDGLFLLRQALGNSGKPTTASIRAGIEALGRNYTSPSTYSPSSFGPSRHDGASLMRSLIYDNKKGTYVFSGPVKPLP